MWLCMWKLTISEEILIWFLDYFYIFALCEQFWKIRILGPLLRQNGSPLGPLFAKNWVPFGSPFYNFWVPLWFGNSESGCQCRCQTPPPPPSWTAPSPQSYRHCWHFLHPVVNQVHPHCLQSLLSVRYLLGFNFLHLLLTFLPLPPLCRLRLVHPLLFGGLQFQ